MLPPFVPPPARTAALRSSAADTPASDWVGGDREAFDWQSVASLAPNPSDDRRADEEWLATDWEDTESTLAAAVLNQLARKIRTGELKVDVSHGATPESTLASVLAALLAAPRNHQ